MSRSIALTVLGLSLLACPASDRPKPELDAESSPREREPSPSPQPSPNPSPSKPSAAWVEPSRTHLLLDGHLPEQASARLLPIALVEPPTRSSSTGPVSTRASGPSVGSGRSFAAAPAPHWADHFVARLAHGGGTRYAVVQGGPEVWTLEVIDIDAGPLVSVEIGGVLPSALTMVGDQVLLGQADTLAWIDLAAPTPVRTELHRRPEMVGKAYDLFVRSGSWLIAIDDQVGPIWADGFRLGAGKPERVQDFTMPSAINGSYYAGELVASGPDQGVLYLLLHYGIMDGHGHDLTALPIRAGKLEVEPDVLINSSAGVDPPVLEEHVDRGSGKPEKLAVGERYSDWTRVVYVPAFTGGGGGPPRLLISAVERGLLELPIDFGPTTKASVIDLGGAVVDVMLIAGRGFALVNVEQPLVRSELVELSLLPSGALVERRTALPELYQRFVR